MAPKHSSFSFTRLLARSGLSLAVMWSNLEARDILRGGSSPTAPAAASTAGSGVAPATALTVPNASDRLARTTQALQAVKQMQEAARNLAVAGPNNLKTNLPAVPVNSWNKVNGLMPATGVPKDLSKPTAGELASLWTGAKLPTVATTGTAGNEATTVTIEQTQQQAVLNWQSFNIGKNTTLSFDQSAGGTNVGQWIAFNKVGVTGSPSQVLGSIKAQGQVYVINPNGIIFGGSSQVNAHALVASALPINDNLIQRGLLNNPDAQFLFSALALDAGKNGTPAFTPVVVDEFSAPTDTTTIHSLALNPTTGSSPTVSYISPGTTSAVLKAGDDYTLGTPGVDGKVAVTFTTAGLGKKPDGATVQVAYTPAGNQYGSVEVQAGAQLNAPTNADRVGGRIALVGSNVTNAGTISTPDGQAILAAGLQVGFAAHASADPTLRGLDVFVGAVTDPAGSTAANAGTVKNDRVVNTDKSVYTGLITAPRGAVTMTGKTVDQLGFIDSSTSVSYNGRVDLIAGYNAVANPKFDPGSSASDFTVALPFVYQSNVGNSSAGEAVANSGAINLGSNSVLRILPETASTERTTGDLALPSQINIQGQSVYLGTDATVLAPGAAVPLKKAYGFDGRALQAGVSIQAGQWFNPGDTRYSFVHADDRQQIYFEKGAAVDVAGLTGVGASVADNIVSVELRGAELANSPLQRDGPLRGQTVQVDLRQHGPWDPNLNWDEKSQTFLGGYTWVGTPLANTAGWVGLTQHTISQLSVNGGSVALNAGGAVVLQKDTVVDVSGGYIDYQGGKITTTKLTADGHIYDIAQATPDRKYTGIHTGTTTTTDTKWGVTEINVNPLSQSTYDQGYRQGGSGGSVAITAPVFALDGTLRGQTAAGPLQRNLSALYNPATPPDPANPTVAGVNRWLLDALNRPLPAQLSLTVGRQYFSDVGNFTRYSPTPANIVFQTTTATPVTEAFKPLGDYLFPTQRKFEIGLAPSLFGTGANDGGFGLVRVDNSDDALGQGPGYGNITVKAGTNLTLAPGGSLNLSAGNIAVEKGATITATGGQLALNAYSLAPSVIDRISALSTAGTVPEEEIPRYDPLRGTVTISEDAVLSTAGALVDERTTNPTAGTLPQLTSGGSIVVNANSIELKSGSRLGVSGGGVIGTAGKLTYGDAGAITLNAGRALSAGRDIGTVVGGRLNLTGATLEGLAGVSRKGGTLNLQAPSVKIGDLTGSALVATDPTTGALTLAPEFFSTGGFTGFSATGLGVAVGADGRMSGSAPSFTVSPKAGVKPQVRNWETLPGGSVSVAPYGVRRPVSMTFKTSGLFSDVNKVPLDNNVDLVVGAGAVLATEPGGTVALSGGSLDVLGRILAPGGSISLTQSGIGSQYAFLPGLHLGSGSEIDASGVTTYTQDLTGYHKADVLDGGIVTISGNIVAEKGAKISVTGATDTVLVRPGLLSSGSPTGNGAELVAVVKDSNGGKVTLQGEQVLFSAATLQGSAGGPSARQGELAVISNVAAYNFLTPRVNVDDTTVPLPTQVDPVLRLSASVPDFVYAGIGQSVANKAGTVYGDAQGLGLIRFGAESYSSGGFGSLTMGVAGRGAIEVEGAVSLSGSRQITIADGGVLSFVPASTPSLTAKPSLSLSAPYVVLGQPFQPPQQTLGLTARAVNGTGQLSVTAGTLIDVGNLVLQGAGTASLDATNNGTTSGAIRGNGTVNVAGDIALRAGQIYPPSGVTFNVIADDYTKTGALKPTTGSVTIRAGATGVTPPLPLTAGGSLNIFAATITQGGNLRAPLGQITLGSNSVSGLNPLSGTALPVTTLLTLQPGSETSVSAVDPTTGKPVTIPYGIIVNGDTWIDPTGTDITSIGPGAKSIALTAEKIDFQGAEANKPAAGVDISGGGDLSAYQFVPGAGGASDILLGTNATGFAIVPGYADPYAPLASYKSTTEAERSLAKDPGYVIGNPKLDYRVGDRIHLEAGGGLAAGDYTLLPARYALLPGAYLLTPQSGAATGGGAASVTRPDGATVVAGYRYNALDGAGQNQALFRTYELAPQAVVLKRAEYKQYSANNFFRGVAEQNDTVAPRLPGDAGRLGFAVGTDLRLKGKVATAVATGGRGGLIDVSSTADIVIGSQSVIAGLESAGDTGTLLLEAKQLSSFGAESLLVGGTRATGAKGTNVTVNTGKITVDNAGEPLSGADVILAANESLTIKDGAELGKSGQTFVPADSLSIAGALKLSHNPGQDTLTLTRGGTPVVFGAGLPVGSSLKSSAAGTITTATGTTTTFAANFTITTLAAGSSITLDGGGTLTAFFNDDNDPVPFALGDGALLRVSSDPAATIRRLGVAGSTNPSLAVGAGVKLVGSSVIADSTRTTLLNENLNLGAVNALTLNSGHLSLLLDQPGSSLPTDGLVLSRAAQDSLFKSATALSLTSYSAIDLFGTGSFGSPNLGSLALHAGTIRGFLNSSDPGAGITVTAKSVLLDNAANVSAEKLSDPVTGTFTVNTDRLQLGDHQLEIHNFANVNLNATGGILTGDRSEQAAGTGGLSVRDGDLALTAPLLANVGGTRHSITTDYKLTLSRGAGTATISPGLGGSLLLQGQTVTIGNDVRLPSGNLSVTALSGDLTIDGGFLDVRGTAQSFYEAKRYTNGGQIALRAIGGDLAVKTGSTISVSADAGGGEGGSLTLSLPQGKLSIADDTLLGRAGTAGPGGAFALDALTLAGVDSTTSYLAPLMETLTKGGFNREVDLRLREGDVVVDGSIRAHDYRLAADGGSITVKGNIDASGLLGSSRENPLNGVMDPADPTGGKIALSASGDVVLAPEAWLSAAGYSHGNSGKGGAISLSAGSFTGVVDPGAKVEIQPGARIDLGVMHAFTPNDLLLNPGVSLPVGNRTDLQSGTLHLRESQAAFGNGSQFGAITDSVRGASGIVLEGYQVFDLAKTDGSVSTDGAITHVGSGGLIDSAVQKAVKGNGADFLAAIDANLLNNSLFHIRPGAEIVNTTAPSATVTRNFVTLVSSASASRSVVNFNLKPGNGVSTTALIPGGLPSGVTLRTTAGRRFTLTTADGVTSGVITATANTDIKSASADNPIVAVNFQNTGATALATALNFNAGSTPLTVAFDATTTIASSQFSGRSYASTAGDLTLANSWDLSTYRFGPRLEPGNLTLRARGNLTFGFDASLSDGFDPAKAVDVNNPLWTAKLMTGPSWSYRLVGGADYSAADSLAVRPQGDLGAASGSVLVGQGSPTLPTTTGVTRTAIIPRYFQTIRTGTGDVTIAAGRDVQLLNPLATIYTAGAAVENPATVFSADDFDVPVLDSPVDPVKTIAPNYSVAQYSLSGGDVSIRAQNDIARYVLSGTSAAPGASLIADSTKELPSNWLYRRGNVGPDGKFLAFAATDANPIPPSTEIQSTSWWVDFSNFFNDVGALGGGDVSLVAGRHVSNVSAAVATNARMPGKDADANPVAPNAAKLLELGGGNVAVKAGNNIDGGVYYVERGDAILRAGSDVTTNSTRKAFNFGTNLNPVTWLPTTFFLGKGRIDVAAGGDVRLGAVANPFWLPQGAGNRLYETSYFSTYDPSNKVNVASLRGTITLQSRPDESTAASLTAWYTSAMSSLSTATAAAQPWLLLGTNKQGVTAGVPVADFQTVAGVLPATFGATAFVGDIDLVGRMTLAPSPRGSLDLLAAGNINGLRVNGVSGNIPSWGSAALTLSDADPSRLPGVATPLSNFVYTKSAPVGTRILAPIDALFAEAGGTSFSLEEKLALHGQVLATDASGRPTLVPLHYNDPEPLRIYAGGGDISGLTLYSGKSAQIMARDDITDVALYIQNNRSGDNTVVAAGRDIIAYDPASPLRIAAQQPGNSLAGLAGATGPASGTPTAGDIQIAGPGTLQVLAGRNLELGSGSLPNNDGTAVGITSVGAARNPNLPQNSGAGIVAAAGVGEIYSSTAAAAGQTPGLATIGLNFTNFINQFLKPNVDSANANATRYLPELATLMGLSSKDPEAIWSAFGSQSKARQAALVLDIFQLVLRNAARDRNNPASPDAGTYKNGFAAIAALFPGSPLPTKEDIESEVPVVRPAGPWVGGMSMSTRLIKTFEGGGITLLVPGGDLTVGRATDPQKPDQGILTERGGGISIFAADSVNVGTSRIFTLGGGNEVLWSTWGNIAAGSGSKTVFSAPPTRVLIDPQSSDVRNDLAGLATGSGIGVLATLSGVKPGDVDLIAPVGTIDAGDAGIRSSGNLNIAARVVLNASNIQVGGSSAGTPPPPPAPNVGSLSAASTASASASSASTDVAKQNASNNKETVLPSMITVEVLGYGGGDDEDDDAEKKNQPAEAEPAAPAAS